jgi:SOS-response transcriptional repressor LexA
MPADDLPVSLSPRQLEVFTFLWRYTLTHGYQPSLREVAEFFGSATLNPVQCHLKAISAKGWLGPTEHNTRAIRFLRNLDGTPFTGFHAGGSTP